MTNEKEVFNNTQVTKLEDLPKRQAMTLYNAWGKDEELDFSHGRDCDWHSRPSSRHPLAPGIAYRTRPVVKNRPWTPGEAMGKQVAKKTWKCGSVATIGHVSDKYARVATTSVSYGELFRDYDCIVGHIDDRKIGICGVEI